MDPSKRSSRDLAVEPSSLLGTRSTEAASDNSLTTVLRLVGPFDDLDGGLLAARRSPAQDWSRLVERIREAATYTRQVEAQAHEQELRVQQLLDRVREDMKVAADRVRAADARVAEMQARTDAVLKDADERVKAAEERAHVAEEWLARVYETVTSEFAIEPDTKQIV